MKKKEFEELKISLKSGDELKIHYRCNWRGGDGRPHNHKPGRFASGKFRLISHEGILLSGREFPINYKAIKSLINYSQTKPTEENNG